MCDIPHDHHHPPHSHDHHHDPHRIDAAHRGDGGPEAVVAHTHTVQLERSVLSDNDRIAAEIRGALKQLGLPSLNLVSSPGSGKTSLLERTLRELGSALRLGMVAGDVQTENDADRLIEAGGSQVVPIVTGGACHLDARMVFRALLRLDPAHLDLLIIENVGNLVCPAAYDLGEDEKVVLISVTEGDDKPLKYPSMFRRASLMVVNKIDLLDACDFDVATVIENARRINPDLEVLTLSCRSGEGFSAWADWIRSRVSRRAPAPA